MQDERSEQRVRAAYRARACAAGIACGAQIFAVGTGLLLPLALNAAYWAAVPALLLGGVIGLAAPKRLSKAPGSAFCAVLALSLLVCGALLLGAGATLAQQTLLPNGHLLTCLMLTLGFCLLAARPGGTGVCRVAFALRLLLPVALVVFAGFSLSSASAAGLFPLLGAGVRPLLLAALLGLSAGSPALMLFLPPQELDPPAPVPKAGFFALRVVLGGLFGVLTLAARFIQPLMTEAATAEMTATGGVMLIGVGLSILGLVKMKLMNALPALVVAVALARIFLR